MSCRLGAKSLDSQIHVSPTALPHSPICYSSLTRLRPPLAGTQTVIVHVPQLPDYEIVVAETLSITLLETGTVWRPGLGDDANLGGSRLDFGCYATFESCCTDFDNFELELFLRAPGTGSPSLGQYSTASWPM